MSQSSPPTIPDKREINQLMKLAGDPPSPDARPWLIDAITLAQSIFHSRKKRLSPAEHNQQLADMAKAAKRLARQIKRLRLYPSSCLEFWRAVEPVTTPIPVRRAVPEDEIKLFSHRPRLQNLPNDQDLLSTLHRIELAAKITKRSAIGRPQETRKQDVIDLAFSFFVRFSASKPSGTPTGRFGKFARAFYAAVLKQDLDRDGGVDRQIRQAMRLLTIQQALATLRRNKSA